MSRIVDINDLVDEGSDADSDDDDTVGHSPSLSRIGQNSSKSGSGSTKKSKKRPVYGPGGVGSVLMCRQVVILVSLVGIIAAASIAIGYAVMNGDPTGNWMPVRGRADGDNNKEQKLLELAERVVTACAESRLDENMKECQKLCHASMCCFDDGNYSCEDDERKNCAVYAGCANLMEGVLLGAAEEDEE